MKSKIMLNLKKLFIVTAVIVVSQVTVLAPVRIHAIEPATLTGRITDSNGVGLANVMVDVFDPGASGLQSTTYTDEGGNYSLSVIRPDFIGISRWVRFLPPPELHKNPITLKNINILTNTVIDQTLYEIEEGQALYSAKMSLSGHSQGISAGTFVGIDLVSSSGTVYRTDAGASEDGVFYAVVPKGQYKLITNDYTPWNIYGAFFESPFFSVQYDQVATFTVPLPYVNAGESLDSYIPVNVSVVDVDGDVVPYASIDFGVSTEFQFANTGQNARVSLRGLSGTQEDGVLRQMVVPGNADVTVGGEIRLSSGQVLRKRYSIGQVNGSVNEVIHFDEAPATPVGLTAISPTNAAPLIQWDASVRAISYEVYRDGQLIGTTSDVRYIDTAIPAEGPHGYKIRAIGKSGLKSGYSQELNVIYDHTIPGGIFTGSNFILKLLGQSITGESNDVTSGVEKVELSNGSTTLSSQSGGVTLNCDAGNHNCSWSISSSVLASGVPTLTLKVTDYAGNVFTTTKQYIIL